MAKNIYSLQLLRNSQIFQDKAAAIAGITSETTQDGVIKLARYTEGDETKTIFGIYHDFGSGNAGYTIYDSYQEVIADIQERITNLETGSTNIMNILGTGVTSANTVTDQLKALSGDSSTADSGDTSVEGAKKYTDGKIEALDYTDTPATGEYVNAVNEANGVISVTRVALPSLSEVYEEGKPIIAVSEDKGQVAASAGTINAEYVNVADAGELFTATTVEAVLAEIDAAYKAADAAIIGGASESANTLGELEALINNLSADAKEYSIKQITTGLSTNVKEAWGLFDADNHQSGATINIYKDSAYKEIYLGTAADTINATTGEITKQTGDKQSLNYAYMKADGTYDLVKVDVSAFLSESEFQSGVTAVDHIVRGVVDPDSETFLTVGEGGFKLAGVQAAINAASGDVKTKLDELSGKTVTGIDMTGGTAAIAAGENGTKKITINTDGSQIKATGYAKGTDASAIAATDSINAALAKLENQVDAAKAAATTKVAKDAAASHLTIASATSADGSVTYTIGESDIASKSDLDAEIAARKAVDGQNGQTYAANANTNYITGATSLNDADVKLDAALKTVADSANSAQTEIDAIEAAVGLNADGTHKTSTGNYTSGADSIEGEIVALDGQVKTNTDNIAALSGKTVTGITMNGTGVTVTDNVAALTAVYTNTAANNENGMVITTGDDGGLTFQFGTLDCGEYN